ncbi:MAG: dipicolinate synthase subunit B [Oscillospiraceae bacterium]|nr:dipicolinate synthase subunit B [Oscillospiraceae bacterium]
MKNLTAGFAMTGSFCTFEKVFVQLEKLGDKFENIYGIMSAAASSTDSRFGAAEDNVARLTSIVGKPVITTISQAEPIGPKKLLDVLIVAPCTGNTLGKLASGITDSSVTMACKSHMRNGRPLVLAIATNDGLSGSAESIGRLLNRKNIYFVPFGQDDPMGKPTSLIADFSRLEDTVRAAVEGRQIQPLII